jgi:hypothetical protein
MAIKMTDRCAAGEIGLRKMLQPQDNFMIILRDGHQEGASISELRIELYVLSLTKLNIGSAFHTY